MYNWTLEDELQRLTNTSSIASALFNLGLISGLQERFAVQIQNNWVRGGEETYILQFRVTNQLGHHTDLIIKACVTLDFGTGLDSTIKKWISRRELLAKQGLATPRLLTYGQGVIIEEYIPHTLHDVLVATNISTQKLIISLVQVVRGVSELGFWPLSLFDDLRSRGQDVVIVDFGQDLGEPGVTSSETSYALLLQQLRKTIRCWRPELEGELRSITSCC